MSNRVEHPSYYQGENGIETIEIIRHYTCDIANALKYLMRAGKKQEMGMEDAEKEIEDLKKAIFYIEDYTTNCSGETCADAARPYMRSLVRMITGHSVKEICEGYHSDIAKAIELLTMVGLVNANGIVRVYHWEQYLSSAAKCIQKHIAALEHQLLDKELESTTKVMNAFMTGQPLEAIDGEDYVSKPGCVRETEPEHYDPLNMIVAWGRVYSLTAEIRTKPNGALYGPCDNCDLQDFCVGQDGTELLKHLCRLQGAASQQYYREVGIAKYRPSFGTVEVVDELKELELEKKRLEEEYNG